MPYKDKETHNQKRREARAAKKQSSVTNDDEKTTQSDIETIVSNLTDNTTTINTITTVEYNELRKQFEEQRTNFEQFKEEQRTKIETLQNTIIQLQNTIIQMSVSVASAAPKTVTFASSVPAPAPEPRRRKLTTKEYLRENADAALIINDFNKKYLTIDKSDLEAGNYSSKADLYAFIIKRGIKQCIKTEPNGRHSLPIKCVDVKRRKYYVRINKLITCEGETEFYDSEDGVYCNWVECNEETSRLESMASYITYKLIAPIQMKRYNDFKEANAEAIELEKTEYRSYDDNSLKTQLSNITSEEYDKYSKFMQYSTSDKSFITKFTNEVLPEFKLEI